jgi:hypothetical protein
VVIKNGKLHLRRLRLPALLVSGLMLTMWSCAPDSGLSSIADYNVVITTYADGVDYGSIRTYAVPDTVFHLVDPDDPDADDISREFDGLILSTVSQQLDLLGYAEEPDPENNTPDILVPVSVTTSEHYGTITDWYPIWGWHPYWPWGPGWGYWYPVQQTYTYSTGTIFIHMLDAKNADPGEETVAVIWYTTINGVLGDTSANTARRIETNIQKAFGQSPYLGAKE